MRDRTGLREQLHCQHLRLFLWCTHDCLRCTTFLRRYYLVLLKPDFVVRARVRVRVAVAVAVSLFPFMLLVVVNVGVVW